MRVISEEGSVQVVHQRNNEINIWKLLFIASHSIFLLPLTGAELAFKIVKTRIVVILFYSKTLSSGCTGRLKLPVMRKIPFIALAVALIFTACNNKKDKAETTVVSEDGKTKVTIDPTVTTNTADEMTKVMEDLKKLPPLTTDQLKALLPEELVGMKRSRFSVNSAMGFAVGEATYSSDDGKSIKLSVWDCAGEAGSGFYGLTYWSRFNMQSETDDGYTKSVDFNGAKAIESYRKGANQHQLMWTANNRLLISVEGDNTGLDLVKQAASSLNLQV